MINAITHASVHCNIIIANAHFLPSSRLTAAIAATHGVQSRQNTRSETAATGLMRLVIPPPVRIVSVETTLSFAINPVIRAVTILQSPNPTGANIGAINPATLARILSCGF